MIKNADIVYSGENDLAINQGCLSVSLHKEWFFSKDKNCYGIPVSLKCTDTTGDAFFHIGIKDTNNNLYVGLSFDYCQKYNAVIWVNRNSNDRVVKIDSSVRFCGKFFPQSIVVDFSGAYLSESANLDFKARAQECYNNLDFFELWKLREKTLCLDGIVLDTVLQSKLHADGFSACSDNYIRHNDTISRDEYKYIYFVWCGLHVGSPSNIYHFWPKEQTGDDNEMNGLKISAVFSHHVLLMVNVCYPTRYVFSQQIRRIQILVSIILFKKSTNFSWTKLYGIKNQRTY